MFVAPATDTLAPSGNGEPIRATANAVSQETFHAEEFIDELALRNS